MTHKRQTIRVAAVAVLTGLTTTGTNVTTSPVYPRDTLPHLSVSTPSETVETDLGVIGNTQTRTLVLMVEGRAQATANVQNTLDDIAEEVEVALMADVTLGGLALDTELRETEVDLTGDVEQPIGLITMTWAILYNVNAAAPT